MRFSSFRLDAVSLSTLVLLAACGGGGGGSSGSASSSSGSAAVGNASSGSGTTTAATNVPPSSAGAGSATIVSPATTLASLPAASGNATTDGTSWLNTMRQNLGIAAIPADAGLGTSSLDHATYLVDNQTYGHTETAGKPGFTGADPLTRIEAEGNFSQTGEVVVAGQPSAFANSLAPVQTLFDAPYHRIIMLDDFKSMGVATSQNASWEAFNIDFGNLSGTMSSSSLIAYPYPGQKGAPTSWYANESPNPFANATQYEMTTVGYPVTIEGGFQTSLSSVSFTITDASGKNVPCLAQTPQTAPDELTNGALCVPYSPLAANTTYIVHVTGTLTSSTQTRPVDVTWTFSTALSGVSNAAVPGAAADRALPMF